jgi:hypothetical protein
LVAAIAVGMYLIGRRRRDRRDSDRAKQPATSPRAPGVSAGWPDPPQDQPPPGIPRSRGARPTMIRHRVSLSP